MRSSQKDRDGFITLSGTNVDAASGGGAANGITYVWNRAAGTGIYDYGFDPRLGTLVGGSATAGGGSDYAELQSTGAGTFRILIRDAAGTLTNDTRHFIVTFRDNRN